MFILVAWIIVFELFGLHTLDKSKEILVQYAFLDRQDLLQIQKLYKQVMKIQLL